MIVHMSEKARAEWNFETFKERLAPVFQKRPRSKRESEMKYWYTKLTGREATESNIQTEEFSSDDRTEDAESDKKPRKRTRRFNNE